jgi:hypothetical protein
MLPRPCEPTGLVVVRVWLDGSTEGDSADSVRARATLILDLLSGDAETSVLAGADAVVQAVERWLIEFSFYAGRNWPGPGAP